jgi:hypothetical protein
MSEKQNKILKKTKTSDPQSGTQKKVEEIDYLTEDPVISDQSFVCVSFLKPSSIVEEKRPKDLSVCGLKVRGVYSSYDEAKARADFLNKCDPYHNIYIAEVGKWCPFEDDPEKAKDYEYMNKDLNKLMKSYWNQQTEAKQYHELRKQDMIQKALEDVNKRKEENSTVNTVNTDDETENSAEINNDNDNQTAKSKKSKSKSKSAKINEIKYDLEKDKTELDKEKKEVDENINTLRRLEEELSEKIKEMELEQHRNMSLNQQNQQNQQNQLT